MIILFVGVVLTVLSFLLGFVYGRSKSSLPEIDPIGDLPENTEKLKLVLSAPRVKVRAKKRRPCRRLSREQIVYIQDQVAAGKSMNSVAIEMDISDSVVRYWCQKAPPESRG